MAKSLTDWVAEHKHGRADGENEKGVKKDEHEHTHEHSHGDKKHTHAHKDGHHKQEL